MFELGGGLRVSWAVVEELFPPGLVDSVVRAFGSLLQRLADEQQLWDTAELGLVGPQELMAREQANNTSAPLRPHLLHEIGGSLRARGDSPAVICPHRVLTYTELDRRAARIARRLRELGAAPNTLVGVVMDKGWEQVCAAVGILQAGAAYLPVEAGWPVDRIHHILQRGATSVVLTQQRLAEHLSWPPHITVLAVDDEATWADIDDAPVDVSADPTDLAYVIFTSGSTGEPKGVMIDHQAAANTITDINTRFHVTAADRVLGLSSLSFDLSVYDIFGMLATGGALVLPEPHASRDPGAWSTLIQQHRVTIWNTVPALMEMLTEHAGGQQEPLDSLRLILLSGDWIALSLPERIRRLNPDVEIISLGGATEASIWSIFHPINHVDPTWRSIPYGKPLTNQTFHVLDPTLQPSPVWVPGELFIGGAGLARGYWADPEKTSERFHIHPETGERLYRTGDLGRYLPDGTIEFLGRNDFQVKINGYRIELGEIEAHLTRHPTVKEAVVTATNNRLTAYVTLTATPDNGLDGLIDELRATLAAGLPDYMLPRGIVVLDALPLSSNGKVDRGALPPYEPESALSADEHSNEPRNDIERRLRDIWAEVLKIEAVGVNDVFGDLGGDSLLALRVISKAAEAGLSITAQQFFEYPTISGLASVATLAPLTALAAATRPAITGDAPLLPAQAMFLTGLDPDVARHHNYAFFVQLDEPMDKVALRVALRTLIERHDALRTGFVRSSQGWAQRVHEPQDLPAAPLEWISLEECPAADQDRAIEELAARAQCSFDLGAPPLLRVLYFDRGRGQRPELLVLAHWLVVDNFSLRLVVSELLLAHEQIARDGQAALPAPSTAAAAWARVLAEHTPTVPAAAKGSAESGSGATAKDTRTLVEVCPGSSTETVRSLARNGATMGDVLLAALGRAAA
ncbi:MAG TPA: amino acid adenylation domain-containing protein, partial [Mycobacterium sp.]|nr:amino acid adenylation domain-containing protein [Mycobacterium sp.]